MKRFTKLVAIISMCAVAVLSLAGCNLGKTYVTGVTKTGNGIYVEYSDGTSQTIEIKDGEKGKDGESLSLDEVYAKYVEEYGTDDYSQFLKQYLSVNADETAVTINECLLSVMKVYTEFIEPFSYIGGTSFRPQYVTGYDTAIYTGSAVVWSMDKSANGDTYIVTNYHVVYDSKANVAHNGGSKLARKVNCYLYGSEGAPESTGVKESGTDYTIYDYGNYAISCELVGGSITSDIAVLRAKTQDVLAVNENVKPVSLAEEYFVGETAIAIGNPEDGGISVTEGIVSVENEYIALSIDGTARSYRSVRMDTAIYGGNSGGGLFNKSGKLIGIVNAGSTSDESINYSIPIEIARGTVENILFYSGAPRAVSAGRFIASELSSKNSKYVFDPAAGYGKIYEQVTVGEINADSIAYSSGVRSGDIIKSILVNEKEYEINRTFEVSDVLMDVRAGNTVIIKYVRNGAEHTSSPYTVVTSDLSEL